MFSSKARRLALLAVVLVVLQVYYAYKRYPRQPQYSLNGRIPSDCPALPGLSDVVLVLKTGVTEASHKLPVHRNTTLRCIPNYIVWSDYNEQIADIPVHDVLYNESSHLHQLPDFNLYTRVQTQGRNALTPQDLNDDPSTPFGKTNPGWKLDKWKFAPMIQHTLRTFNHENIKWYIFMEADTYILWSSMLSWLAKLNPSVPYYLGNQMQIRDVLFAHGGSGFVLSRPAIENAAHLLNSRRGEWYSITEREWAGDCVLGMLLKQAGIDLSWSWPMLQIAPPSEIDHFGSNYGRTPWCYPAVSFHHLQPEGIADLVRLENSMSRGFGRSASEPILWRDVFYELSRPKMRDGPVRDWDCEASEEKGYVRNVRECRSMCMQDVHCLQYVRRGDGMCAFGRDARVGEARGGAESGWVLDRIDATAKMMGECPGPEWIL